MMFRMHMGNARMQCKVVYGNEVAECFYEWVSREGQQRFGLSMDSHLLAETNLSSLASATPNSFSSLDKVCSLAICSFPCHLPSKPMEYKIWYINAEAEVSK